MKILDFGLARAVDADPQLTADGCLLGTPAYMSPEQARGEADKVDGRSDVYSLGVILYRLLTGEAPFRGNTRMLLHQVLHDEPRPPRRLNDRVPRDLETICLKALAKEPRRRYQTAGELAEDLRRFLHGEPIRARPTAAWERAGKWAKRRPAAAALLGVSALAALALFVGGWWHLVQADAQRREAERERQEAVTHLYHSLVGEARALRLARASGYRAAVWDRLKRARSLETPDRDLDELRAEAVACLGDFVGLEPTVRPNPGTGRLRGPRLAPHPDGVYLALGLSDGTVLLHDLARGADLARLRGHRGDVTAAAFSADGKRLVTADVEGALKAWESDRAGAWACTRTWAADRPHDQLQAGGTLEVALSPDGRQVAACAAGTARVSVWNLADGTAAAPFHSPYGDGLRGVAWSPDGLLLAAGHTSQKGRGLLVWDVASRECRYDLPLNLGVLFTVTFSRDGRLLAVGGNQGFTVFDTRGFRQQLFKRGDQVHSLVFSPDNRLLFVASEAVGVVRVWDLAANREAAVLDHPAGPFVVALSRDGDTLFAASPKSLRAWDLRGPDEKRALSGHDGGVPHVAFSPDGRLLASAGKDGTVRVWDPGSGKLVKLLDDFDGAVEAVAFTPDGRTLATADMAGGLRLWDVASGKELPAPGGHGLGPQLWTTVFSSDGAYFAAGGEGGLRVWRVIERGAGPGTSWPLLPPPVGLPAGVITSVCFSPDGRRLACVSRGRGEGDHRVYLCDLPSGPAHELPARLHYFVRALAFSPDGRRLTFVSGKQVVEVWDVADAAGARPVASFGSEELVSGYGGIALSADGAWFACGNQTVTIWDTASHQVLLALPQESSTVWARAWSPNRELLAVSSSDGGPVIWDLRKIRARLGELRLDW